MVNKQVLRDTYLEKRLFLPEAEYELRNRLLLKNFISSVDLTNVNSVHTFLPIPEKKEVNTWLMIQHLRQEHPSIKIFTSRTLANARLEHYHLQKDTRLKVSKWGIPEPSQASPIDLDYLDIIIVPLIICDKLGHRIGYGKGYYDRFLKNFPVARKIGVSLSPPLDKINFMNELDVTMHTCLTPYKTYSF